MPISYSLGLGALAGALWIGIPPEAVMLKISDGVSKVAMLTIPFFVLAGAIMAEGGMARRLVALANVIVGMVRVRGGLSAVNILATTFLSGISGSSVADTSAIGSVMIPQMEKVGYPRVFATNVTISALGAGDPGAAQPQRGDLFAGDRRHDLDHQPVHGRRGAGPAARRRAHHAVPVHRLSRRPSEGRRRCRSATPCSITIDAAWGLITIVIIIGGILLGIFTAIEAGAVACVWAFFVTMFIYRDYRWRDLPLLVHRTLKTVAMVMTLIAMASSFGYVMALMQMPAKITAFFLTVSENKYVILMLINFMLLVLGCLMDMAPLILICTPILLPVVMKLGVDPVHFGMIMLLNLGIGLLTPPVGSVLFVGCAVGKVKLEEVMRGIWPFYGVMFVVLMLVTFIPALSLWLPSVVIR